MAEKHESSQNIIDSGALDKAGQRGEYLHAQRSNDEDRWTPVDHSTDLALQAMHNRIEGNVTDAGPLFKPHSEGGLETYADLQAALKYDLLNLTSMGHLQREQLMSYLLQAEGYNTKRGGVKERGADEGVFSIGININTGDYKINRQRGQHERVVDTVAAKVYDRMSDDEVEEGVPSQNYFGESQIAYGLIHYHVPGFLSPILKLVIDRDNATYSNGYITVPKAITQEQMERINNLCITQLQVLPVDKMCNPLIASERELNVKEDSDNEQLELFED